jgi:hypothetical protein
VRVQGAATGEGVGATTGGSRVDGDTETIAVVGWLERFDEERAALSRDDIATMLRDVQRAGVRAALDAVDSGLDPRYVRGGVDRLLLGPVRRGDRQRALAVTNVLIGPIFDRVREGLGEDDELDGVAVTGVLDDLIGRWGVRPVRLALAFLSASDDPATGPPVVDLLESEPRLKFPGERSSGAAPDPVETLSPAGPGEEAEAEPEEHDDGPEADVRLFSSLDTVLIRHVVATFTETIGALPVEELRQLVDEVVKLNVDRHASFFHLGFLDALDDDFSPPLPEPGMNEHRRRWLHFGRLSGLARREGRQQLAALAISGPELTGTIVGHPRMGSSVTAPVVDALLADHPQHAAQLLGQRLSRDLFSGWEGCVRRAHHRARELLVDRRVREAESLWTALALFDAPTQRHLDIDAAWRLVTCARARDDFPEARRRLADLDAEADLGDEDRALLASEHGLIEAEIPHIRVVTLGHTEAHRANLRARLQRGRAHFEKALSIDAQQWRAALCLGVLLALEDDDHERAAGLLDIARSHLAQDPLASSLEQRLEIQFRAALERLRTLQEGTDGRAFKDVRHTVRAPEWTPPAGDIAEVLDLLVLHGSRHAAQLLTVALEHVPAHRLAGDTLRLLDEDAVDQEHVLDAALRLGRSGKVAPATRLELLTRVVDREGAAADRTLEALDVLDELLRHGDAEVDRAYAGWLARSSTASELYGAIGTRVLRGQVHERLGEREVGRSLVEEAVYRSAAADRGAEVAYGLEELLARHRELDADGTRSDELMRELGPGPVADVAALDEPVRVLFVGGDERQARHQQGVEQHLRERFGAQVAVTWIHPGWSSNWAAHADRAEATYDEVDAMVLMPFVRTNLGRRLRRSVGEHGLPWVACTGPGRDRIARSLSYAVEMVASQR